MESFTETTIIIECSCRGAAPLLLKPTENGDDAFWIFSVDANWSCCDASIPSVAILWSVLRKCNASGAR